MIRIMTTITLLTLSTYLSSQVDDEVKNKMEILFEITNVKAAFQYGLDNTEGTGDIEFDKLIEDIALSKYPEFEEMLIETYSKYLSEEEADKLIELYTSDVGKILLIKMPKIKLETMNRSFQLIRQINEMAVEQMDSLNHIRLNSPIDSCEELKSGKFEITSEDQYDKYTITRHGNDQLENYKDDETTYLYTIKWKDKCEYELIEKNNATDTIVGSILQLNNDSFKFIEKNLTFDFFIKGTGQRAK